MRNAEAGTGAAAMTMTTYDSFHEPRRLKLRRGLALPFYALALVLSFVSEALGYLGARIAQDP
jgi:hypothetical protein